MKDETRQKAREWFRDNALACIAEMESGAVKVNAPSKYRKQMEQRAVEAMRGDYDSSFTFLQRAHYIETGECIVLLS